MNPIPGVPHKLSGGEDSRCCLPRGVVCIKYLMDVRMKGETPKISSQLDAMPVQSHRDCAVGDPSVLRFHCPED